MALFVIQAFYLFAGDFLGILHVRIDLLNSN